MNVHEQGPQIPEHSLLLERGGLTPAHWQEVLKMIGKWEGYNPNNPIPSKIISYAQKVISGEFPDAGFHHRQYLGSRHWDDISRLPTTDRIEIPRRFPFLPARTDWRDNKTAKDVVSFAREERWSSLTLDDCIYRIENPLPILFGDVPPEPQHYRLRQASYFSGGNRFENPGTWTQATYRETVVGEISELYGGLMVSPQYEYGVSLQYVECDIQNRLLLNNDELPPPFKEETWESIWRDRYFSAASLGDQLRKLASENPSEFRERLKAKTPHLAKITQ